MGFFAKIKEKFRRFMYGRYGADQFYNFLCVLTFVLIIAELIIGIFAAPVVKLILGIIIWIIIIYSMFRCFSKNISKRRAENNKFLACKAKGMAFFKLQKDRIKDRKTHVYRKCHGCGTVLRLPKRKGTHTVVCPRCGKHFDIHELF